MNQLISKFAYKRWTPQDVEVLKELYISGREQFLNSNELWDSIALKLNRKPSEVRRKVINLYKQDSDLASYKQNNWTKEKILEELIELYLKGEPFNLSRLPSKLRFILLKSVPSSSRQNKVYFDSPDQALAEAALTCGYARNDDGSLDYDSPLSSLEEAHQYIVIGNKKRHVWTLDEIKQVLSLIHTADYPITLPFLTNHFDLYKNSLGINRKLESFKDVVKKFIEDGQIKSYPDLVCTIAPEYIAYYNPERSRLSLSTEEIRVKKFLDRYKIPYIIPKLSEKLPTGSDIFSNVVPDFVILNEQGKPIAIVEVFGSIGDRINSDVDKTYNQKTEAKITFYNKIPDMLFIDIYNNQGKCDLGDQTLFSKFEPLLSSKTIKTASSLEDILCDQTNLTSVLRKFAIAIVYNPEKQNYSLHTEAGLDYQFDKLEHINTLSSKVPLLKALLDIIISLNNKDPYYDPHTQRLYPAEHIKDYSPLEDYMNNNRKLSTSYGTDGTGPVG